MICFIASLLLLLLGRLQDLERAQQTLIHTHHSPSVVELAAVVWCREQRDELALAKELVPVLDDLMRTAYQVHIVLLQEAGHDVWAEGEGNTSIVFAPAGDVLVRIRPQQIAEQSTVRDLSHCQQPLYHHDVAHHDLRPSASSRA